MVTATAGVKTDMSKVVHPLCRPMCHSFEPQISTICISSLRPTHLGDKCSGHKLVGSCCPYFPFHDSPSQGDPVNLAMQLHHYSNSPRLARDALALRPDAAQRRSHSNLQFQEHFSNNPTTNCSKTIYNN